MLFIFKNRTVFLLLFMVVLLMDVYVKLVLSNHFIRYVTKPMILVLLILFSYVNYSKKSKYQLLWICLGLFSFLIGDLLIIKHTNKVLFAIGMSFFIIGKFFYCVAFSHGRDFKLRRIVPFLLLSYVYTIFIYMYIYNNLDEFLIPSFIYFFMSLLCCLLAYLRKDVVDKESYILVFFGTLFFVLGESIIGLKMFYQDIPFQDFLSMFFYGIAQYLIITGLIYETKIRFDEEQLF